jgi:hypothetical protein
MWINLKKSQIVFFLSWNKLTHKKLYYSKRIMDKERIMVLNATFNNISVISWWKQQELINHARVTRRNSHKIYRVANKISNTIRNLLLVATTIENCRKTFTIKLIIVPQYMNITTKFSTLKLLFFSFSSCLTIERSIVFNIIKLYVFKQF